MQPQASAVADSRISRRNFDRADNPPKKIRLAEIAVKNVQPNISQNNVDRLHKICFAHDNYKFAFERWLMSCQLIF